MKGMKHTRREKDRKRAFGAGRKFKQVLRESFLMLLVYYLCTGGASL